MPSVQRFAQFTIDIYGDDHAPPHCHVVGRGFKAMVRLSDLQIDRGTLPRGIYAEAVTWAAANLEILTAGWNDLNDRD